MLSGLNMFNLGEYFYKFAEQSRDLFWICSADYNTPLYINPAYELVWGISRDELYKNTNVWLTLIHSEDKEQVQKDIDNMRHCPVHNGHYSSEYRIIHPNHEIRWIQESRFPLFDANQQLLGFAGVARDITIEKQRFITSEKAANFFRLFVEKMQQIVFWARDPACNTQIYVSPSYEKIWGRSCDSLYQNPNSWIETLIKEDRVLHSSDVVVKLHGEHGKDIKYENRYRIYNNKKEVRWIKDTSFPIYDEQESFIGFAGVAEDITKDVLHEQALREAKQRAEVANQAKSDFLAMISHELRTPLHAILGTVQILQMRDLPTEFKGYMDMMNEAGNNLLSLVNDILDFVKLDAGQLSFEHLTFNLYTLIEQAIQNARYQTIGKKIDILFHYKVKEKVVTGDPNRVKQVIANLLSNAVKYTEAGSIKIDVQCQKRLKRKGFFEISVTDTGIGISEDKLDYIFEKFSQVDSSYSRKHQGLGLGLAIVKGLVETMGGKITVKSHIGQGSQFRVLLPFLLQHTQGTVAFNDDHVMSNPLENFNMNILLIEDNVINQKVVKVMLEDLGCVVDILDHGKTVLADIDALTKYQLIFMDIGLPDMSGFEIASKLRLHQTLQHIPIVALTAHILGQDRKQAKEVGINSMLAKPISYENLMKMLRKYCNHPRFSGHL